MPQELVRRLYDKAEEYLVAAEIEIGQSIPPELMQTLRLALLEDFIEVHNNALGSSKKLPESKEDVAKLLR